MGAAQQGLEGPQPRGILGQPCSLRCDRATHACRQEGRGGGLCQASSPARSHDALPVVGPGTLPQRHGLPLYAPAGGWRGERARCADGAGGRAPPVYGGARVDAQVPTTAASKDHRLFKTGLCQFFEARMLLLWGGMLSA